MEERTALLSRLRATEGRRCGTMRLGGWRRSSARTAGAQAGMLTADKLLTVSPTYAKEMSSGPDLGVELDEVIRRALVLSRYWCACNDGEKRLSEIGEGPAPCPLPPPLVRGANQGAVGKMVQRALSRLHPAPTPLPPRGHPFATGAGEAVRCIGALRWRGLQRPMALRRVT